MLEIQRCTSHDSVKGRVRCIGVEPDPVQRPGSGGSFLIWVLADCPGAWALGLMADSTASDVARRIHSWFNWAKYENEKRGLTQLTDCVEMQNISLLQGATYEQIVEWLRNMRPYAEFREYKVS